MTLLEIMWQYPHTHNYVCLVHIDLVYCYNNNTELNNRVVEWVVQRYILPVCCSAGATCCWLVLLVQWVRSLQSLILLRSPLNVTKVIPCMISYGWRVHIHCAVINNTMHGVVNVRVQCSPCTFSLNYSQVSDEYPSMWWIPLGRGYQG